MQSVIETIRCARLYLWQRLPKDDRGDLSHYELHGALQYRLCDATNRLLEAFGEVTRKDVALLVEAWVMAQGTLQPERPLKRRVCPA